MPQSYGSVYLHIIFSTKRREPILTPDIHTEFVRYITPILKEHQVRFIAEGGMPDHVHLLIDLGREVSVATILREVKAKSSAWLKKKLAKEFSWQSGYGYFSVSPSHLSQVVQYIHNQQEHHRRKTFEEEYAMVLQMAGVEYDPRFLSKQETD